MTRNVREFWRQKISQLAEDLAVAICEVAEGSANKEMPGLTDRLRAGGVYIASLIAEGASRAYDRDFTLLCEVARNYLSEIRCQVGLACRVGVLPAEDAFRLECQADELNAALRGFISAVTREDRTKETCGASPGIGDPR